jgi:3-methyladenine DNA glycosylase AlkD
MSELTAKSFLKDLVAQAVETGGQHASPDDAYIGVRMGTVFALAKIYIDMPLNEIEALLESPIHKARVGAVSIMDYQARAKKTSADHKKALFDLYIRRHDRVNTWDLVDRSAIYVIGSYLIDKPRGRLYKLARSPHMAERRTAIVSTLYFIKKSDTADTFKIAKMLQQDKEDLIHKAVGWALRSAGGPELVAFLDAHAAHMPRVMLRYAIEKLPVALRKEYLNKKKQL